MLGWHVIIYRQNGTGSCWDEHTIADWECGMGGIDWLDELVKEGLIELVEHNGGYPIRYAGKAKVILPHLSSQPAPYKGPLIIGEDYVMPSGWKGHINIKEHSVRACLENDETILVTAWDQS